MREPRAKSVAFRYIEAKQDAYYHVTLSKNVPSILRKGLFPAKPGDMADVRGVYLFKDKASVEDALMNWLGDRLPEDARLDLLKVDARGVVERDTVSAAGFEVISKSSIAPEYISVEQRNI